MGRGLSDGFMRDLRIGLFKPILELIKLDATLCLEIRENYINIYYRGGNILRIEEKGVGNYNLFFDRKYLNEDKTKVPKVLAESLITGKPKSEKDIEEWINAIPLLKHEMDLWFGLNPKEEREFQQLLLRENNVRKSAKGTDYYICDIEYANKHGRFDLIAVRWPSSSAERKNNKGLRLAFVEMKYLDVALKDDSGIIDHLNKLNMFLCEKQNIVDLKEEMKMIFNQKIDLGLIDNKNKIKHFGEEIPEFIFVLANHDPASKILFDELSKLSSITQFELKFAVSNFMGYGLYLESIYSLEDFKARFPKQIYNNNEN